MKQTQTSATTKNKSRRPHVPTDATREAVSVMVCCGVQHRTMAKVLGITTPTLNKHYRHELDCGKDLANSRVAATLYQMAISGEKPAATFFWLKTQAGWRETTHLEVNTNYVVSETPTDQVADVQAWLQNHAPPTTSDRVN